MAFASALASNGLSYFLCSLAYILLGLILIAELKKRPLLSTNLAALKILAIYGLVRGVFYFGELFFLISFGRISPLSAGPFHELIWVAADYLTVVVFAFFSLKLLISTQSTRKSLYTVAVSLIFYWIFISGSAVRAGFDFSQLATWHKLKPFFLCIPSFTIVVLSFKNLSLHYKTIGSERYCQQFRWLARAYGMQAVMILLSASAHVPLIPHLHNPAVLRFTGNDAALRCIMALILFSIVWLLYTLLTYSEKSRSNEDLSKVQNNLLSELSFSLVGQVCDVLDVDSAAAFIAIPEGAPEKLVAAQGLPFKIVSTLPNSASPELVIDELKRYHKSVYNFPIEKDEAQFGTIVLSNKRRRPLSQQDRYFLQSIGRQTARTIVGIRSIIDDVETKAIQEERLRISREMHDGLSPLLAYVRFKIELAKDILEETDQNPLAHTIDELDSVIHEAFADVRESITGLRCSVDDDCFVHQLHIFVEQFRKLTPVEVDLQVRSAVPKLCRKNSMQAFRIIQEVLTNVRKHAQASKVSIIVDVTSARNVEVVITDNGIGFDVEEKKSGHFGLSTMRERSQEIKADLAISSTIGKGTMVKLTIPLNRKEPVSHNDQSIDSGRPHPVSRRSGELDFVQG